MKKVKKVKKSMKSFIISYQKKTTKLRKKGHYIKKEEL